MNKNPKVYWLCNDEFAFEKDRELIGVNEVTIGRSLDSIIDQNIGKSMRSVWPSDFYFPVVGTKPVDLLLCTSRVEAVSERAKKIIENTACDEVEFLPLKVLFNDGKKRFYEHYWVLNILCIVDEPLDWKRTVWTQPEPPERNDKKAYMKIFKPCFIEEKIAGKHFFHSKIGGVINISKYLSRELVENLKRANSSLGMHFSPVHTSHENE